MYIERCLQPCILRDSCAHLRAARLQRLLKFFSLSLSFDRGQFVACAIFFSFLMPTPPKKSLRTCLYTKESIYHERLSLRSYSPDRNFVTTFWNRTLQEQGGLRKRQRYQIVCLCNVVSYFSLISKRHLLSCPKLDGKCDGGTAVYTT